ncbi:iron chaperone [Demequina litorisediminis]|uniref:YdhG-like domain-containing protein n=1 Tax=Demequina litorisediminis TaxID=1849022 RepID=A0ABQ6ID67_9MICO|nr:DUF1801 domain-containing protein [Demequina litorisediminis]GMA35295.1 hypothetical protein GCM10025876_14990 [Demequina litorisediminis]
MATPASHDEYIAAAPESFRPVLTRLRTDLAAALPGAEEIVAYGMPGFRLAGGTVIGYAAFTKQCGLYLPADAITANAEAIKAAGLAHTKTGVTFTASRPLPSDLLTALVDAARRGDSD